MLCLLLERTVGNGSTLTCKYIFFLQLTTYIWQVIFVRGFLSFTTYLFPQTPSHSVPNQEKNRLCQKSGQNLDFINKFFKQQIYVSCAGEINGRSSVFVCLVKDDYLAIDHQKPFSHGYQKIDVEVFCQSVIFSSSLTD